jgi:hypothetical protein
MNHHHRGARVCVTAAAACLAGALALTGCTKGTAPSSPSSSTISAAPTTTSGTTSGSMSECYALALYGSVEFEFYWSGTASESGDKTNPLRVRAQAARDAAPAQCAALVRQYDATEAVFDATSGHSPTSSTSTELDREKLDRAKLDREKSAKAAFDAIASPIQPS